jgi:hypothetical protein
MSVEERIDDLIDAGWRVLDSDFDPTAFHRWRLSAFDCLKDMLGSDHYYARHFAMLLRQGGNSCGSGNGERSPTTDGREPAGTVKR